MTLAADTHNRASAYSESCKAAGTLVDDPVRVPGSSDHRFR